MNKWFTKASYPHKWLIVWLAAVTTVVCANWIHHRSHQMVPASTCAGKLEQLDFAVTQWAISGKREWNEHPDPTDLRPYFRSGILPTCEDGGQYQLGTDRLATVCTKHGIAHVPPPPQKSGFERTLDEVKYFSLSVFGGRVLHCGNACVANLKQIDGAVQQWALAGGKKSTDVVTNMEEVATYLKGGEFPPCPQGGKYHVGAVSNNPTCTIIGHSLD